MTVSTSGQIESSAHVPAPVNDYRTLSRWVDRQCLPRLKPPAQAVLRFIFDLTVGDGQVWVLASAKHFLWGVTRGELPVRGGCGLATVPSLRRALDILKRHELIQTRRTRDGYLYALNHPTSTAMPLKQPKKKAGVIKNDHSRVIKNDLSRDHIYNDDDQDSDQFDQNDHTKGSQIDRKNKSDQKRTFPTASLRQAEEAVLSRLQRVRADKLEKAKASGSPGKMALAVWKRVCLERHGQAFSRGADCVKLASLAKRLAAGGMQDLADLLEWSIANWQLIMAETFGWMKGSRPDVPSIPFFVRFVDAFMQAWRAKRTLEQTASMTERERLIQRALRKGKTQEAAEKDAEDVLGITRERKALEAERKALEASRRLQTAPLPVVPVRPAHLVRSTDPEDGFGAWDD